MGKQRAILYLLVGYPGSGKTKTSQALHNLSGAVHIWADYERRVMFGQPTHSAAESRTLYKHLNNTAELLLSDGSSVIFDTNFNFRRDRDMLRRIAARHGADCQVIWVKVPKDVARRRAKSHEHALDNKYIDIMTDADFERMTGRLEAPDKDESPVVLDGTLITPDYVAEKLKLGTKV